VNINKGLDELKVRFANPKFQKNEGLGNQIGFYLVSYNPKDEMEIRYFLDSLKKETEFRPIVVDLYDIFLKILKENDVLDAIGDVEKDVGSLALADSFKNFATPTEFVRLMDYKPHKPGDILIISGIGKVYPFIRLHTLLESMGDTFRDIPVVSFYPGKYDGRSIILFNKFFDDNHYRSFDLVNLWED
jgi:hypothetical protein